jgi:hypothetical protein
MTYADRIREAQRPLGVSLIAVDRNGALYAVLDPREVRVEQRGPELSLSAMWRLLLWNGASWRGAGYALDQTESERAFLEARVQKTLVAFDGLSVDEFRFRAWSDSAPECAESASGEEIDQVDATVGKLRQICRDVILGTPNQEESLFVSLAFEEAGDYVLQMRDEFDRSDYYVPVPPGVNPRILARKHGSRSMQTFRGILVRDGASPPTALPGPFTRLLSRLRSLLRGA